MSAHDSADSFEKLLASRIPVLLFVTHELGGGVQKHVDELARLLADSAAILSIRPYLAGHVELTLFGGGESQKLFFRLREEYSILVEFLRQLGVQRVHFHHILGFAPIVTRIPRDLGVPYDFTVHDYYTICPQINLTGASHRYCGEPDVTSCNRCLKLNPVPGAIDITVWRAMHRDLIVGAERALAPSQDVADRMLRYFPDARIVVASHVETQKAARLGVAHPPVIGADGPLKITALGLLTAIKGADLLEDCALDAKARGLPIEFHLIGYGYRSLVTAPRSRLTVHGRYRDEDLDSILYGINPHLLWFPALWPETYSYALSYALRSGIPLVVPNLGAFPERVAGRDWTWVSRWSLNASEWNDFFVDIRTNHFLPGKLPERPQSRSFEARFSYRRDYLAGMGSQAATRTGQSAASFRKILCDHSRPKLSALQRSAFGLRRQLVSLGLAMRGLPLLRPIARKMPLAWQMRLRNLLLGN